MAESTTDLVISSYYDTDVGTVEAELDAAVDTGLTAAAARLRTDRQASSAGRTARLVQLNGGLPELDGSSVAIAAAQDPGLVEVQIRVPWRTAPNRERRALAAAAFSGAVDERLREAAARN